MSAALRVPLSSGIWPSVLVPEAKAPVAGPVCSLTWSMVMDCVGGSPLVSTVNARLALATRPAVGLVAEASWITALRLWPPSAKAVPGVNCQVFPLTLAWPSRVAPS